MTIDRRLRVIRFAVRLTVAIASLLVAFIVNAFAQTMLSTPTDCSRTGRLFVNPSHTQSATFTLDPGLLLVEPDQAYYTITLAPGARLTACAQ